MNKKRIPFVILILALLAFTFYRLSKSGVDFNGMTDRIMVKSTEEEILTPQRPDLPVKAAFSIYTNGTFRIFTAPMYHHLSEDVYITAEAPNVVVVEKRDFTWQDFFSTLPFSLNKDCLVTGTGQTFCTKEGGASLRFYINGELYEDALENKINEGDRLLVTYGPGDISDQLSKLDSIRL